MGWGTLQRAHQSGGLFVRSIEFAVVIGLAGAGWAAGAEAFYFVPLLVAGLIVGLLCTTTASWHGGWKIAVSILVVIFFAGEIGLLYWHARPHVISPVVTTAPKLPVVPAQAIPAAPEQAAPVKAVPEKASPKVKPLLVQCDQGFMPTLTVSPTDRVHVVQLQPIATTPSFIGDEFLLKGGSFSINRQNGFPIEALTCKVTNYGSGTLVNVVMNANLKWWNTTKEGNTTHMADFAFQTKAILRMDKIDSGATPYIFFVINFSDKVADLTFPDTATGTNLETTANLVVPTRATIPTIRIFPTVPP